MLCSKTQWAASLVSSLRCQIQDVHIKFNIAGLKWFLCGITVKTPFSLYG